MDSFLYSSAAFSGVDEQFLVCSTQRGGSPACCALHCPRPITHGLYMDRRGWVREVGRTELHLVVYGVSKIPLPTEPCTHTLSLSHTQDTALRFLFSGGTCAYFALRRQFGVPLAGTLFRHGFGSRPLALALVLGRGAPGPAHTHVPFLDGGLAYDALCLVILAAHPDQWVFDLIST